MVDFIFSAAKIFAYIIDLKEEITKESCKDICDSLKFPTFAPFKQAIQKTEEEKVEIQIDYKFIEDSKKYLAGLQIPKD